jgi:hypothetical protein
MARRRLGRDHADDHAERGRLAGAVAAQQAHDLAGLDGQADLVDDRAAFVGLHQIAGSEQRHGQKYTDGLRML